MSTGSTSDRREQILNGALIAFEKHGLENTTMAHIAEESELPEAIVWKEFPGGKSEIHESVWRERLRIAEPPEACQAFLETIEQAWETKKHGAIECLLAFFESRARYAREHPLWRKRWVQESILHQAMYFIAWATKQGLATRAMELVERLQRDGVLRRDVPARILVRVIASSALGRLVDIELAGSDAAPGEDAKDAWYTASTLLDGAFTREAFSEEEEQMASELAKARGIPREALMHTLLREANEELAKSKMVKPRKASPSRRARDAKKSTKRTASARSKNGARVR